MQGSAKEIKATEAQAIARAYRQGQEEVVTIVRFIIKDTLEHRLYLDVYGDSEVTAEEAGVSEKLEPEKPVTPARALVRATSDLTQLLNIPSLKRSGSFMRVPYEEENEKEEKDEEI